MTGGDVLERVWVNSGSKEELSGSDWSHDEEFAIDESEEEMSDDISEFSSEEEIQSDGTGMEALGMKAKRKVYKTYFFTPGIILDGISKLYKILRKLHIFTRTGINKCPAAEGLTSANRLRLQALYSHALSQKITS